MVFYNIYIPYEIKVGSVTESRLFAIPMIIMNKANNKVDLQYIKDN